VGKPEGERPLERPGYKGEDNVIKYLKETGWEDLDWHNPAQNSGELL
jgi:hypothetical protein